MPNGRPGDSRHHDIVHHRIETFGPACDALVRAITARLPPGRMRELQDIIEIEPMQAPRASPPSRSGPPCGSRHSRVPSRWASPR
jgi:hypothetical protein